MKVKELLLGKPRDINDPHIFHQISLIAFLAWVGLGADGLSSSAYGPDEAFRAIIDHPELAVFLALATAGTVLIISLAYSKLIEHFPHGGGGYVVATKLLGPSFGVVSGCALLVDYILTITTSMAAAVDQIFSFLPLHFQHWKMMIEAALIVALVMLNLRGVKESVMIVVPIFLLFCATHIAALIGCLVVYGDQVPRVAASLTQNLKSDANGIGLWALFLILMNAYSRGAGTYTGIEAVSNGVPIMREPKVKTAKRTMLYMALSLALTAGGILICYLLADVHIEEGKTLNAVLFERLHFGNWFVILTLCAEGGLLLVAAQTGFIDGPRVMANMALDGWLPHRFSALSEQLTMSYGVVLIGAASMASLFYSGGDITMLVTMYSINVFVTFSLSQLGMCRFWVDARREGKAWGRGFGLHALAFVLCASILIMVVLEKFSQGAWMTVVVTSLLIGLCFLIRAHYRGIQAQVKVLSDQMLDLPIPDVEPSVAVPEPDPSKPIAVLLVAGYSGLGVHALLTIQSTFPNHYKQVAFASIGVFDSGIFKGGEEEVRHLRTQVTSNLEKYAGLARRLGLPSATRMSLGTDPVAESEKLCREIAGIYPRAVFFGGKLIFKQQTWYHRTLHNETAFAIQRRLHWVGIPMVVLPVRINN